MSVISDLFTSISSSFQTLLNSIELVRLAIVAKGVAVPAGTPISAFPAKIGAIQSGSSTISNGLKVTFIDYDGSILKTETVPSGSNATPPANPAGDDVRIFSSWCGNYQNVSHDEVVGARYWFNSDMRDYIFIKVDANTGLTLTLRLYINSGTANIIWGDGTSLTTSGTGNLSYAKTYAAGEYRIAVENLYLDSKNYLGGNSTSYPLISLTNVIYKAYIGWPSNLGMGCFRGQVTLESVCLSNVGTGVTTDNQLQGFYGCTSLKAMVVPASFMLPSSNVGAFNLSGLRYFIMPLGGLAGYGNANDTFKACTSLEFASLSFNSVGSAYGCFQGCSALKALYFKAGQTNLSTQIFYGAYNLDTIQLPSGLTNMEGSCFYNCYQLKTIDIPSTFVSTSGGNIIDFCWRLTSVIIRATTPPTISGTYPFFSSPLRIRPDLKFFVPDASLAAYKAATTWIGIASRIFPLSQYTP